MSTPDAVPTGTTEVDLRELRVFLTAAEELHFGRTADLLGLSRSRVSQTVARLERRLGGALFRRTSRQVELTAYGARVRDQVGPAVDELLETVRTVALGSAALDGILRLGYSGLSGAEQLVTLIEEFRRVHPGSSVQLLDLAGADPIDLLRRRDLDAFVTWAGIDVPGIAITALPHSDTRSVAVAAGHRLTAEPRITWQQLAAHPVARPAGTPPSVYDVLVPLLTPEGEPLRRDPQARSLPEVLTQVARGDLVHVAPTHTLELVGQPGIAVRPLRDAAPLRAALAHRLGRPSPALSAFVALLEPQAA